MVNKFLDFLKTSTNPYEAVESVKTILVKNGFKELVEQDDFKLEKGKSYFVKRNNSSIIAFKTPSNFDSLSFNIVASHTDSPTFKIKPNFELETAGYKKLNTEVYGSPIFSSFFDRPLSISGRVFLSTKDGIAEKLINFNRDLVVIPNECIHFNREVNDGKKYNPQVDLIPLFSQEKGLYDLIEEEFGYKKEDILSFDLSLYNRFRGSVIGANKELFIAPQIDNLESVFTNLMGFLDAKNDESLNILVAFDNEEVGSETKQGAASTFLVDVLNRIKDSFNLSNEAYQKALASSFIVSCDNAHAVHPNDAGKTDENNKCFMNKGIVIKHNANQRYTTDGNSDAIFKYILKKNNVLFQDFTNRSDVRGGSTLGAISSTQLSIPSVDIGLAQLAMHSCCETAGVKDLEYMVSGIKAFYSSHLTKEKDGYRIR